ncbi:serine/threonine protein kinase [Paenibacillus sp. 32O-W]|jgi:serine/threonine-protein kinase RsbT|uniref:Serine/threonine protein kinase n=1 Tax=Paenibacillus cisolokensis TaxID=1658519 RepID=A0ABQ4NDG7_9BACL|nr:MULTISPECIES: hypothetical protein [Paenibacillus]ALS29394.1 serine/threonine protein kinase [Paenibacillus sp. 32O-W]GIQ66282.1 serine/threonine protein kinase [Paenibacillus cisolokensis]
MDIIHIRKPADAIKARQKGREIARALGFGLVEQTRIAFAISELSLKLIELPEQGHLVIKPVCKGKQEAGIEVRLYEHHRGPSRLDSAWAERLVDALEVKNDRIRWTLTTARKWLIPSHCGDALIASSVLAAGEE